ncbi:MAG: AmmeMemoRadiSam system radical SAM enzyme [Deltaproteobacteria bacterium]|nr:AmmeMemoRadiSam system radical SAM enzyme [Deltaproteobacteria bacterium]MBW2072053.1 AmmeMemoRadiSam system radical SAM enzyme [Deltaproteobacteria bacterium]
MWGSMNRREFLKKCGRGILLCSSVELLSQALTTAEAGLLDLEKGYVGRKVSPYFTALPEKRIRCELCPRFCEVDDGDRGYCGVRENNNGKYYSLVYGNPCAVHVDPIEKKPFFHVLPGSRSFSLATAGCNFDCKFCQNWEISQALPDDTYNYHLPPEEVARQAERMRCSSVASTYVEPTIFMEYMQDIGAAVRQKSILNVMHSNGYVNERPLAELCRRLDAACIDLKGFSESYYQEITEGTLAPVLETLKYLRHEGVHLEIVNLMIPGKNDDPREVGAMCQWIKKELGTQVPLHFSRFYPMYKLKSLPPTPISTLERAVKIARQAGLHYVYIGNVPGHPAENTNCPRCNNRLISRTGYRVEIVGLSGGKCRQCGQAIPGIWQLPQHTRAQGMSNRWTT